MVCEKETVCFPETLEEVILFIKQSPKEESI
jgi:hypothetical protein